MHLHIPFTIDDCRVALFPAWRDGLPKRGPAPSRHSIEPLFQCVASLSWRQSFTRRSAGFGSTSSAHGAILSDSYNLTVSFPEGVVLDAIGRSMRMSGGGPFVLVALFHDEETGEWQRYQFFHVATSDDGCDAQWDQSVARTMSFTAGYAEEHYGRDAVAPELQPVIYGHVDWISGGMRFPALRFDLAAKKWEMIGVADTGMENQPLALWDAPDVSPTEPALYTFSLFQPRTIGSGRNLGELDVLWQQRLFFSLESLPVPTVSDPIYLIGLTSTAFTGDYMLIPAGTSSGFPVWSLDGTQNAGANIICKRTGGRWMISLVNALGGDYAMWRTDTNVTTEQASNPRGLTFSYIEGAGSGSPWILSVPTGRKKLLLHQGITVECNGSPEPIEKFIQDPLLEESYCVFRVLDRVYMTVGHDRIAVPRISSTEPPPSPNFRFLLGDTILDDAGWWLVSPGVPYLTSPSQLTPTISL